MLPFLKRNQDAAASGPVDAIQRKPDDGEEYDSIHACAEDLINAVHSKNIKGAAEAIRAAFEILESEPHNEGSEG